MSDALATYLSNSTVTDGTLNLSAGNYTGGLTLGANGIFNFTGGTFVPAGGTNINTAAGSRLTIASGLNLNLGGAGKTLTNGGATIVNGTLTGNLTNNAGGYVGGSGTITGALVNNGTVNPGNSPGTLTVGTYTSNPGSTQIVEIASASNYDKIITTAAGGATLNGGTLSPRLLNGYLPSTNTVFNVIQTTGGGTVTGAFAGIDNTRVGTSRTLFWQALYNPTSVDLKAVGNYTPPDMALSRNQLSVGNALNSLAPSTTGGDLLTVLDAINALTTDSSVAAAYNEISPAKYAALTNLSFAGFYSQYRSLAQRVTDLRFGAQETGTAIGPGSFNLNYSRLEGLMLAYNSSSLSGLITSKKEAPGPEQRWGIFVDPNIVVGSRSTTAAQTGYNFTTAGFTAGGDFRVTDNLLVGLATGYSHTGASFKGSGGSLENNAWPILAYAAYLPKNFYAFGSLGYTLNLFDLNRTINFGPINRGAKSSPVGNQFNLYGETGYDVQLRRAVFTPLVSLAYSQVWVDGFTEGGAGALNLKVNSQSAASVQTGVGAKVAVPLKVKSTPVVPQVYASWQHEYANGSRGLDARLSQGGSAFTWRTDTVGRDFAVVGANVTVGLAKNLTARLDYNAEVGRRDYSAHNINVGLRWQF
jgi:outer membrane autotransporter protein